MLLSTLECPAQPAHKELSNSKCQYCWNWELRIQKILTVLGIFHQITISTLVEAMYSLDYYNSLLNGFLAPLFPTLSSFIFFPMFKILIFNLYTEKFIMSGYVPITTIKIQSGSSIFKVFTMLLSPFLTWATLGLTPILAVIYIAVRLSKSLLCFCGCVLHMWNLGMCPVSIPASPIQDFLYTLWLPEALFSVLLDWKMGVPRIFSLYTYCAALSDWACPSGEVTREKGGKNNWKGLPWWSSGGESAFQCRGLGSIPGLGATIPLVAEPQLEKAHIPQWKPSIAKVKKKTQGTSINFCMTGTLSKFLYAAQWIFSQGFRCFSLPCRDNANLIIFVLRGGLGEKEGVSIHTLLFPGAPFPHPQARRKGSFWRFCSPCFTDLDCSQVRQ